MRRLIPACAGKTFLGRRARNSWRAHPRVCGENAATPRASLSPKGSSPRVRGKPERRSVDRGAGRLIPACAGKTSLTCITTGTAAAHPRVCGENETAKSKTARRVGSSPRVRGKRLVRLFALQHIGLIPACAGKTLSMGVGKGGRPAHPRVCGENVDIQNNGAYRGGSSPRVRGKLDSEHLRLG